MKLCIECNSELSGRQKKFCCRKCKQNWHYKDKTRQPNTYHSQSIRAFRRKLKFVKKLGGKCKSCGYSKNLSALEFNHIDPSNKSFSLCSRKLSNTNLKELEKEVEKCELLCANCHREHHNPESEINNVRKILS